MTDEQTNKTDTQGNEDNKPVETSNKKTDEALSIVDEAKKVRDEIKSENDRREKILQEEQRLRANDLLGGTTGGRVEPKVEEVSDEDYSKKALSGELNDKKL